MYMVIGGVGVDGGGWVLTPRGPKKIGPWQPHVRTRLDAVVKLAQLREAGADAEVDALIGRLVREAVAGLGVEEDVAVTYFSQDGAGFTCSGTGRPVFALAGPQPGAWRAGEIDVTLGASV